MKTFCLDQNNAAQPLSNRWYSISDLYACNCAPDPPPPYEIAIRMPPQGDPPPFTETPGTGDRSHSSPS